MSPDVILGFTVGLFFGVILGALLSGLLLWRVTAALVRWGQRLKEHRKTSG